MLSAVAAAFPLFAVQLFTNVSRRSSSFFVFYSNTDNVGPLIELGMHFDWLHRTPVLAISLLILQIWCQNTSPDSKFAPCIVSGFIYIYSDQFFSLLGNRIFR
jgi:hypothetical protein